MNNAIIKNKENFRRTKVFFKKQGTMLKYLLNIEMALIHLALSIVLLFAAYTVKQGYYVRPSKFLYYGLLFAAGIQGFRACKNSLTPVLLFLSVGIGGEVLLAHGIKISTLDHYFFQTIAAIGFAGLVACAIFKAR